MPFARIEGNVTKRAEIARDTLNMHPELSDPPSTRTADEQLLERESELADIRHALEDVASGSGRMISIEGPPGVGKTAMLRAAASDARQHRMLVLRARGFDRERDLPFGIVRQVFEPALRRFSSAEIDELLTGAARLAAPLVLPDEAAEEPAAPAGAQLHGLYWLLANLAERAPVFVAVDDLQWADAASLSFVRSIAQRLEDLPILLAVGVRSTEPEARTDEMRALLTEASTVVLPQDLSAVAVAHLVRARLGESATAEFCDACRTATGGNPFLVRELLNELRSRSVVPDNEGAARVASITPVSVSRRVLDRIARLPEDARALGEALSVLGDPSLLAPAAALAGLDVAAASNAADALSRSGIVDPGYPLSFHHPIVRATVYEGLEGSRRADLHAQAAILLEAAGAAPERVAVHLLNVPAAGNAPNVETLRSAARRSLARGAAATAAVFLRRALAEPPTPDVRPPLLYELGHAELGAGELAAVSQLEQALHENGDAAARTEIVRDLARAVLMSGDAKGAVSLLDAERDSAEARGDEGHVRLEADSLSLTWVESGASGVDPVRIERALGLAGETPAERALLAAVVPFLAASGATPAPTIADVCGRALGAGQLLHEQTSESPQFVLVAQELAYADELIAAAQHLDAGIADARRRGTALGFLFCSGIRSMIACRRAEIIDAVAFATQAVDVARQNGWVASFPTAAAMLADSHVEQGDLDGAESVLKEAELPGEPQSLRAALMMNQLVYRKALVRLARGDAHGAVRELTELDARKREIGDLNPGRHAWLPALAIALSAAGDRSRARAVAEEATERARTWGTKSAIGIAMRTEALMREDDERVERLKEAVSILAGSPSRLELLRAEIDLGAALAARDDSAARTLLREALDLCLRSGATALAERARKALVAAGGRPRRVRLTGSDALTPSELRVARLAASGLSNPAIAQSLFLTRKTIETHLSNVYRKLGINSREQLAQALES